jgi:hypothetical protein
MSNAEKKAAGRPKAKPSELCLRRIGKHFEAADQLLSNFQDADAELRESGYGKQPFNSYVKSLQEKLAMYEAYIELLSIYADDAGYEIDTAIKVSDEDKERPWSKLKETYRDSNGEKLSLNDEFKERRIAFDGSRKAYNKSYPFIDWCAFWFESEINAAKRLASQAIMSFDLMNVNYLTLDESLTTNEARKGRNTFINKQGKNIRDTYALQHSNIIRHKNRLRKAAEQIGIFEEEVSLESLQEKEQNGDKAEVKKAKQAIKLAKKIEDMEAKLYKDLENEPKSIQIKFDITLTRKERLRLVRLNDKITPMQKVQIANLDKKLELLKAELEEEERETEKKTA